MPAAVPHRPCDQSRSGRRPAIGHPTSGLDAVATNASDADDLDRCEAGEVGVLGPDLGAVDQGGGRDPRVVHPGLSARRELAGCQPGVGGRGAIVGGKPPSAPARASASRAVATGIRVLGHEHAELDLGERDDGDADVVGEWPFERPALLAGMKTDVSRMAPGITASRHAVADRREVIKKRRVRGRLAEDPLECRAVCPPRTVKRHELGRSAPVARVSMPADALGQLRAEESRRASSVP